MQYFSTDFHSTDMNRRKSLLAAVAAMMILPAGVRAQENLQNDEAAIYRNLSIFNSAFKELNTFYVDTIDVEATIENALMGMLYYIDPYTEYIPAKSEDDFKAISTGEYGGIGSVIMQIGDTVCVSEPYEGSPAARAGLLAGDRIAAIDGENVVGLTTSQVSEKLKGLPNTKVLVTVDRPYCDGSIDVEIIRQKIKIPAVPYYGVTRGSIGYINLSTFSMTAPDEVRAALLDLKSNPAVESIVLDLRGNGGGLLECAVQIVGMFVPKGTMVLQTRGRFKQDEKTYKTTQEPVDTEIPLVVLIDGSSASASEIVAGSLQDLDRALIVGSRSFGKGLVQTTRQLPFDGQLKVTIAKYYIPSGRLIQAIDYSHRNSDGSATRIPDSLTTVFHTANGREVRDGGGIIPDVAVESPDISRLTYKIWHDNWSFNFATLYAAQNPTLPPADEFVITDSIYAQFKAFIDPEKFKYDKVCEDRLKSLRQAAKSEGYMTDEVSEQFDILEKMLKHNLDKDLDTHRDQIAEILGEEILKRYYYQRGGIIEQLKHDEALDVVVQTLSTEGEYERLLGKSNEVASGKQKKK